MSASLVLYSMGPDFVMSALDCQQSRNLRLLQKTANKGPTAHNILFYSGRDVGQRKMLHFSVFPPPISQPMPTVDSIVRAGTSQK